MERTLAHQAARGRVPERGRPAVAEHDLVAVGNAEQLAQALADLTHELLDRLLAVRGAHHGGAGLHQVLELLGADPGRA